MRVTAEVNYRRHKIVRGEFQALMTDEIWFLRTQVDRLVDLFAEDFTTAKEILDVGAGTCWFAAHMKQRYDKDVLSLDVSEESMELSKELYGFKGPKFVGEIHDLTALGQKFDLICCSALLHHIENLGEFYFQIADLLRPGGLFVAFNEPRTPHFLMLRYIHRLWFGRSARAHGVLDLPRTLSEYLDPVPGTLESSMQVDYEKSRRNYEQLLGKVADYLYSFFAERKSLSFIKMYVLPEAIILAMRRKKVDGWQPGNRHSTRPLTLVTAPSDHDSERSSPTPESSVARTNAHQDRKDEFPYGS